MIFFCILTAFYIICALYFSYIDIKLKVLYLKPFIYIFAIYIVLAAMVLKSDILICLLCALAAAVIYFVVYLWSKGSFGAGDVYFAAFASFALGVFLFAGSELLNKPISPKQIYLAFIAPFFLSGLYAFGVYIIHAIAVFILRLPKKQLKPFAFIPFISFMPLVGIVI